MEFRMKTYRIDLARVEYYAKEYIIEAANQEDAIDKAWDMAGNWQRVESEEFTNGCEEIINHEMECGK
jgi:hypothetical protein